MEGNRSTTAPKEIVYIYNGDKNNTETDYDPDGAFPEPEVGALMNRDGKNWKITGASMQAEASEPVAMPVLEIDLTDKF